MLNEQGGELVAVLRGANAPMLQRMIVEELAKEKLVLEQGGERKVVRSSLYTCIHTYFCQNNRVFLCRHAALSRLVKALILINFSVLSKVVHNNVTVSQRVCYHC